MKYVLDIQSGAQHLYNIVKSGKAFGIIEGDVKTSSDSNLKELYYNYIDELFSQHYAFALHYHRYGECVDYISDSRINFQINFLNNEGVCSGCLENIADTVQEQYEINHDLFELARDVGEISVHQYTPGSMNCILIIELENPYMFQVLCDDLMNTFLNVMIYNFDVMNNTIYKTTINGTPNEYVVLPNLKMWLYTRSPTNDIVRYMIEDENSVDAKVLQMIDIFAPNYLDELYTFVEKYLDAVYTIQNCWKESRYNPDGNLCKKWCAEIQAKWNEKEL